LPSWPSPLSAAVSSQDARRLVRDTGEIDPETAAGDPSIGDCVLPFEIAVGKDARFYEFEIGGAAGPTISRADLEAQGWTLVIALESWDAVRTW
jgi:hypothetical protein